MSVTLLEVVRAARVRAVPFSGESAGYIALALCEDFGSPRRVELAEVELGADGRVRLLQGSACDAEQTEQELRQLLAKLLKVSSSPGPALLRVASRVSGVGLSGLANELEKALIPLNRAASRRALLRLYRETERALKSGRLPSVSALTEA